LLRLRRLMCGSGYALPFKSLLMIGAPPLGLSPKLKKAASGGA
jgi:hypothetical protein